MAKQIGLCVISITDHDAIDAVPEAVAAGERVGLRVIPGIEMSCETENHEVHILGYHLDITDDALLSVLDTARQERRMRAKQIVAALQSVGVSLSWERVCDLAGRGVIGRPHIAQAMCEEGCVDSIRQAFERYLGEGCVAYVERLKLCPEEAIRLILDAGGVPVMAHPWGLEHIVPSLVAEGLAGLEVYYGGYGTLVRSILADLAAYHGLVCTGGSDFHGLRIMPDRPLGGASVPARVVGALEERHRLLMSAS